MNRETPKMGLRVPVFLQSGLYEKKKARQKSNSWRALQYRGDRRLTFPNDFAGAQTLWLFLPQPIDFTADTFYQLGVP
jgi:hypothetical protein